jgi:hypothetical protein
LCKKAAGAGAAPGFGHQLEAGREMFCHFRLVSGGFGQMIASIRKIFAKFPARHLTEKIYSLG